MVTVGENGEKQEFGTGAFGDAFGAVNALFTGMALVALAISIILQRRELSIVRGERRNTQKALQLQIEINKKLEADLDKRRLEGSFFQFYKMLKDEVSKIEKTEGLEDVYAGTFRTGNCFHVNHYDGRKFAFLIPTGDSDEDPVDAKIQSPSSAGYPYRTAFNHFREAYRCARTLRVVYGEAYFLETLRSTLDSVNSAAYLLISITNMERNHYRMILDMDFGYRCKIPLDTGHHIRSKNFNFIPI